LENTDQELTFEMKEDLKTLKILTNTVHALLCRENHLNQCQFYKEEMNFEDPWIQEHHIKWLQVTKLILKKNKIDPKILSNIFESILKIIREINCLLYDYPKMASLIKDIFDETFKYHFQNHP